MINSAYERGDYDWLYENYLGGRDRLMETVLHHCHQEGPETALDLCCGTGHVTKQLLDPGKVRKVLAVDSSWALLAGLERNLTPHERVMGEVQRLRLDLTSPQAYDTLSSEVPDKVDLIVCRQGVGYIPDSNLLWVPSLLKPGGRFFFNAFVEPRPLRFRQSSGGILEAGCYLFGKVYHLQFRWPRVDLTTFEWKDIESLSRIWSKSGLEVDIQRFGRTFIVEVTRV